MALFQFELNHLDPVPLAQALNHVVEILGQDPNFIIGGHRHRFGQITPGNLGANLRKLEDAGYIAVNKTFVERKPRTFISATPEGRQVFQEHVTALESILKKK